MGEEKVPQSVDLALKVGKNCVLESVFEKKRACCCRG